MTLPPADPPLHTTHTTPATRATPASPPAVPVAQVPSLDPGGPAMAAWGALLAAGGQGVALKEAESGRYVYANEVLLGWVGRLASDIVGRSDAEIFDAATYAALRAADLAACAHGAPMAADHHLLMGGQMRDLSVWRAASPGTAAAGWLLSVWVDQAAPKEAQTQLKAALGQIELLQTANDGLRRELAEQVVRDPASGLYTKAQFEDQLRREVDLSSREHREFSIVFVEIDPPPAPAAALAPVIQVLHPLQAAVGRLLRGGTRAMDAACRLDDRLFAVLLSGVGLATAHSRMEGLRRRCATEIVVHEGREIRFTVAMGVASFPHTAHTQSELLQACTAALHEAQRRGGNHVALAAIRLSSAA